MTEWISFYRSFSRFSPSATYVSLNHILGFLFFFLIASFCISLRVPGFSISLGFFQLQSLLFFYFILFYLYFNRFFYTHTHTHKHRLSNGVMLVKQYNVSLFKVKCGWILDRHFSYLLAAPHIYQIYINVDIIYIYIYIDWYAPNIFYKKKEKRKKRKKDCQLEIFIIWDVECKYSLV